MAIFFIKDQAIGGGAPGPNKTFSWPRAIVALVSLAIIFVAGAYCAHDDKLAAWSTAFLHSFEVLLGGLVGMIVGESSS